MFSWTDSAIDSLLNVAESALRGCIATMNLPAQVVRKDRAVGIIPLPTASPQDLPPRFTREQLEETVLVTQQVLETSPAGRALPFCAFNGGHDVFVDIGDKSWGVLGCQRYVLLLIFPPFRYQDYVPAKNNFCNHSPLEYASGIV